MALDVSTARHRAASIWGGFTSGQKTMLGLAVVGAVVGGLLFTQWAAQPTLVPLYGNLSGTDAAAVTSELSGKGVPYKLADGGATVLVPQSSVYQMRLDMSAKGLPTQGSPGYALLDKQGITTSEFRQRVDYQRALEGELARTIGAIDGVKSVDVHLVIPVEDVFTDDASKPSASVLLRGTPGARFSAATVTAIVHLVASSVEGLQPEAVTVADAAGRVLSAPGATGAAGDAHADQSRDFEDNLARSIEAMLVPVTGANGAVVRVRADLNFDERSTVTERFDQPNPSSPLLSESTSKESFNGAGAASAAGVVGTAGAPAVTPAAGSNGSNYQKDSADRSFAIGKVTEQVKSAPGRVSRLSVAVLLDNSAKAKPADVQALVTAAAGIDPGRGDVVSVQQMAFDHTQAKAAEQQAKSQAAQASRSQLVGLARTVGVLLIVLVALLLAWRSAKKATVTRYPIPAGMLPPGRPGSDTATAESLMAALAASAPASLSLAGLGAADGVDPVPRAERALTAPPDEMDEIAELIDRQPDEVAQILRSWLADRRG
jgi:flagellar M-ring protein FliF